MIKFFKRIVILISMTSINIILLEYLIDISKKINENNNGNFNENIANWNDKLHNLIQDIENVYMNSHSEFDIVQQKKQ